MLKQRGNFFLITELRNYLTRFVRHFSQAAPKDAVSINSASASFLEDQYNKWRANHSSVHPSWHAYFSSDPSYASGALPGATNTRVMPITKPASKTDIDLYLNVQSVIRSYQQRGHLVADLDPLGIIHSPIIEELGIRHKANTKVMRNYFNFTTADMDKEIVLPSLTYIGGKERTLKLREIIERLESVYCNKMGLEFMFMTDHVQVDWIKEQFETPGGQNFSREEKRLILERLTRATGFEEFLAKKYSSEKRFGLEGCEILIPALKQIIDESSKRGVSTFIIGMAHRGRLNVLSNVCRKSLNKLLTQFSGLVSTDAGSGDVKYHLGTYIRRFNRVSSKNTKLAIIANPSHLEFVNPLVAGRVRAEQFYEGDSDGSKVMGILIHGDAANSGQGIVYEVSHLSDLPEFKTGGTIHVVINNQIGFTTDPRFSRSSRYCTDVQKVVDGPIFHVNADHPESVIQVCNVAAAYRDKFHRDLTIDLVAYRRNGHNEIDEPSFTQPLMYKKIRSLKNCYQMYSEKCIAEGIVTAEEVKQIYDEYEKICNEAHAESLKITSVQYKEWIDSPWEGFFQNPQGPRVICTGVPDKILKHIGKIFSSGPLNAQNFELHRGIERVLDARMKMVEEGIADWALGEALAFGTLLKEGTHVRLSGQDVERGTFSHRHHVLHNQNVDKSFYCALAHLYTDQAKYSVVNSSLSESAVLGFEHGYSMANPNNLTIWEAQFGDFVNNAQVIIDQFIVSGEAKWVRQSGLVLLLPHGMEGMGPEHSSCRPERFLQLSQDDPDADKPLNDEHFEFNQLSETNLIVANCSTPANIFHILRRQVHLPFRKPLVVCTPKYLLRLPACRSPFKDMGEGTRFKRLITDPLQFDPCEVKQMIFCTGKTYYDLATARKERGKESSSILHRVEQICPFPYDLFAQELAKYPNAEVIWAQEEHKNQGWWNYVLPRMLSVMNTCLFYRGRKPAAAPSTGSKHQHYVEVEDYYCSLFGPAPPKPPPEPEKEKPAAEKKPKEKSEK